ncbi:MAG: glycosyltransferase family 39 protein [Planctomycetes bacterium]|nr:glycosyltransferase family 39 protein [Planctomycetota bacterium]
MPSGSWTQRDRLSLYAVVVATAASLFWLSHSWFDASNDAAIYIQCARALLAGEGYTYLGEPFIIRPPGFSVLLMPVLAARGVDFGALNLYVGVWGVACAALFFVWARTRVTTWTALALTALVWFNPGFAALRSQVMSDVPGAALLFACLLLERWSARRRSIASDVVLGVAVALAAYVRSLCVVLVPAIVLARLLERAPDAGAPAGPFGGDGGAARAPSAGWGARLLRIAPFVAAAVLVQLPWSLRNAAHHPEPPVDQTSLYDYSTGMWHADRGDPASERLPLAKILERVPPRAEDLLVVFGSRMQAEDATPARLTLGALFVLAIAWSAWRRRSSAELFACGALGLVLPYFKFEDRLLLPVVVIGWTAAAELLELAGRRVLGVARAPLGAIAPVLVLLAIDFHPRGNWDAVRTEHETYARWCQRLAGLLPQDARVAVPIESWRYSIYLDRPVWTLFFGWNRGRGPAGAEAVIDRRKIDTVVITPFTKSDGEMGPYFVQKYGIRMHEEGITIVRVR